MDTTASPRQRRWRQFSLRTLLALTFLAGLLLSFWVTLVQPYRREGQSIARLREDGAVVTTEAHGPAWWATIAGDDFIQRIVQIEADGEKTDDADLALLATLPQLRMLVLGERCRISDSGLRGLQDAENLADVMIDNRAITNEGLQHLGQIKQLHSLRVRGSFTDEGVNELGGMHNLQALALASPHLTDAALPSLAPLTKLRELRLIGCFTDAGMAHLQPLTKLERLSCTGNPARATIAKSLSDTTILEVIATPLTDVANVIADMHEIPVEIDPLEFRMVGRDALAPITCDAKGLPLRSALDQFLAPYDLGWKVHKGAVVITTKEAADRSRANTLELQKRLPRLKEIEVEW